MTIACSVVDLSRLPSFPHRFVASVLVARSVDRHYALRMLFGVALAPTEINVVSLASGSILWLLKAVAS